MSIPKPQQSTTLRIGDCGSCGANMLPRRSNLANKCRRFQFKRAGLSVSNQRFSLTETHAYATLDIRPAIVLLNTQISTAEYRLDRIAYSKLNCVFARIGWLDKSFDSGLATKRAGVSSGEHRCERNRCRLSRIENVILQACSKSPIVVLQFAKCVVLQESVAVPSERIVCYERKQMSPDGVKPLASGPMNVAPILDCLPWISNVSY